MFITTQVNFQENQELKDLNWEVELLKVKNSYGFEQKIFLIHRSNNVVIFSEYSLLDLVYGNLLIDEEDFVNYEEEGYSISKEKIEIIERYNGYYGDYLEDVIKTEEVKNYLIDKLGDGDDIFMEVEVN